MVQRFVAAGLLAAAGALASVGLDAAPPRPADGYELWSDCSQLPDDVFEFLPVYLPGEAPGLVDLGQSVALEGLRWRALQYTRDKTFGPVQISTGRWYSGMGAERWPVGTVDPAQQLDRFRITTWEVDGVSHAIDPSCVLPLETEESSLALYNVWVRFTDPGVHTLKIVGRQVRDFFFLYPYGAMGTTDPLGLSGRRVFLRGEAVGDVLDGEFVHRYELVANRDQ